MGVKVTTLNPVAGVAVSRPRVSVVVTEPTATVSMQLMAASVFASVAGASVSMVIPVTRLSYIALNAAARTDSSGLFQFFPDTVYLLDQARKAVSKGASDSVGTSDAQTFAFAGACYDTVALSESFYKLLTFNRALADQFGLSDLTTRATTKARTDSVGSTDTQARAVAKLLADSIEAAGDPKFQVSKAAQSAVATSDLFAKVMQFARTFADSQSLTDSTSRDISLGKNDPVTTSETLARAFAKVLTDGVGMNDSAEATDGLLFQSAKSLTNVAFTSDASYRQLSNNKSDVAAVADAGLLVTQGYCDLSYFAEDYVGDSRTF